MPKGKGNTQYIPYKTYQRDVIGGKEYTIVQEEAGDMEDLKKVVAELQKASKMHLAQSKRVQAHVDMMKDAGMGKNDAPKKEETITSKELLDNKYKEEKNGAQHFSKVRLRTWYTLWREKTILNS
jgi:hypothetical protein